VVVTCRAINYADEDFVDATENGCPDRLVANPQTKVDLRRGMRERGTRRADPAHPLDCGKDTSASRKQPMPQVIAAGKVKRLSDSTLFPLAKRSCTDPLRTGEAASRIVPVTTTA
jgi:hypothetical protein